MNKRLIGLLSLALLPTIIQLFTILLQNHILTVIFTFIVHVIVPIVAVTLFTQVTFKQSFLIPLQLKNKKITIQLALLGSLGALIVIFGSFFLFKNLLDLNAIVTSLQNNYGITKLLYLVVALEITLLNPFMEEFFWRGFVFRVFDKYLPRYAYWTGLLFGLHHTIIIMGWFNWWQFISVTAFLSLIGILFNWIYKKTKSIYATLVIHFFADIAIAILGFLIIF